MEIKCSYSKLISVDELKENPKNTNNHPEKQVELLAKIIEYQGFRHPIVVSNLSGYIVAGHGRLDAAKLLGIKEVPVDYQSFENESQEMAFLESDNLIADLAEHNYALMIQNIKDLDLGDDFDLDLFGIPDLSLESLSIETKNTSGELDLDSFDNFQHECPKCGFEWSDNGSDNS